MPSLAHISDASGSVAIYAALLDPDDQSRREVADALTAFHGASVREFSSFPAGLDDLPPMLEGHYAAVLIGNSSAGIIESAALKTWTLDIGDRQKGRETGLQGS